jgi:hypothetical protein
LAPKGKWTLLTYIAADNDLYSMGKQSYDQIIKVGSTAEIRHGVLFDWPAGAARYIAGKPGLVQQQEQLGDYDSADPERLIETARWVFERYPAERYGLILWSHGTGWAPKEIEKVARRVRGDGNVESAESNDRAVMPGSRAFFRTTLSEMLKPDHSAERAILFDDGTGHALDTLQLDRVTGEISKRIGQKLDFIGMDACLMASVEVAYQLRKNVACMAASEELVPGQSWPYDLIFQKLATNPEMTPRQFSDLVVQEYVGYYGQHPPAFGAGDITKIALDLSRTEELVISMRRLAECLMEGMKNALPFLEKSQTDAYLKETRDEDRRVSKFNYHLWDIVSVCRNLSKAGGADEVQTAAGQVLKAFEESGLVVRSGHLGEWFEGIGGLSAYWIPPNKGRPRHISGYYPQLDFAQDASWARMLEAYRYGNQG